MSEFADLTRTLIRLQARAKAAESAAKPIRSKVTELALDRYTDEGSDRWSLPDGLVSLVKPKPHVDVSAPETLCDWLAESGRDDLITRQVQVVDHQAASRLIRLLQAGERLDAAQVDDALGAFDVRRAPLADWTDAVQWEATDDGTLVTAEGEVIPGCVLVTPPIRSVTVRPSADLVEAEQRMLMGDDDG